MLRGKGGNATNSFLSVRALTNLVRNTIHNNPVLQNVWVQGEVSNFRHHSSGHMYFNLQDESARLKCVMFSGANQALTFRPRDGITVIARGRIDVYLRGGEYQLIVQEMHPYGLGLKFLEFERLKKKLEAEGLFARKRALPRFPERIGLITSEHGAAVHDVLRTLARLYPRAEVVFAPALVQGDDAVPSLLRALERLRNHHPPVDVLLVVRGGGDIEDLWVFNDETLVRALYAFPAPVVTGIGHESDVTLADFVADLRAPTPTGAAERVVPDQEMLLVHVRTLEQRLFNGWRMRFRAAKERVEKLARRRVFADPLGFLGPYRQTCDRLEERLEHAVQRYGERARFRIFRLEDRLRGAAIRRLSLAAERAHVQSLRIRLHGGVARYVDHRRHALALLSRRLEGANPLRPLARGYAYLADASGRPLVRAEDVFRAGRFTAYLSDGALLAEALELLSVRQEGGLPVWPAERRDFGAPAERVPHAKSEKTGSRRADAAPPLSDEKSP
ncbi:exodeoxyribonuclease VII large subunit [Brockia lithotrophica]|uniref:Exodeoxyribonuclease 7 large subunit n=1 Tax=Brockia lithotrophica TaxID=933949 RepID=A0A660L9W1_9BACL|nr:exodeoxyribonuclease VII large subunit [Brockia lithotrophica]RKQ88733.1 exodeoxyribonuclease VII large subunit [Brockia lithotrophica]